ncbi:MAG: NAD(P)H-dependent oxidoreductase, partial [Candidatus Thorarchaeota archaeon]
MRVSILVFSPTGNTLKVAKMLETSLLSKKVEVDVIDVTRDKKLFRERNIREYLNMRVKKHDLLCIGAPVYAHHLHYNVKNIINSLPKPGNGWGRLAVPFVTYGGINSGIALQEAGKLLKRTGRIPVSGMKINSQHSLSKLKRVTVKVNEGMPGEEIHQLIEELAEKIVLVGQNGDKNHIDISQKLCYQNLKTRIKAKLIIREKICQNYIYPKLIIDRNKCTGCGKCSRICPVQRIEMSE